MYNKQLASVIAKVIIAMGLDNVGIENFDFRVIVQKVGYILQKIGCNLDLKFGWYTLGPYSKNLQNYYSAIANILNSAKRGNIDLELEVNENFKICSEKTIEFLNAFKQYMGELNIKSLEVLASLLMLCTDIYPQPKDSVSELLKRKGNIPRDFVEKIWIFLRDKNICTLG
ncbi:MAG: hypothetical protein QXL96_00550 [Ignisphaera sp.]